MKHRGVSLFESSKMTAETREWWLEHINKDIEKENKQSSGDTSVPGMPNIPKPHIPKPSVPRVPKR
jgi:hypothetical protein